MMSIFILIGAYRYYAELAERFGKTKWQLGLLAIGIYLGFQIVFLFCYGIYQGLTNTYNENNYTGFSLVNIISWLFAIGAVYGFYRVLENRFRKETLKKPSLEIEEIGSKE
ncbi:hypothetical protein [Chryseobacterium sp. JUb7]|uniref:hypothetical protein n=1 Tax=Chryseobacterium sp. JUb7 TaxID=2940599 RepID=UPI00216757F6|nr:hypothetical protein [Chryseobacterium sp. JUb7]MCS3530564.1 hypothetical protein [Chryseobacterium sp. JUb7]